MKVCILIATYGGQEWRELALSRAFPSARDQAPTYALHLDDGTLAEARNQAAAMAPPDATWFCFLDGDDELAPGYIDAMRAALARRHLLTPQVQYVDGSRRTPPRFHQEVAPENGNWLVIGTLIERGVFEEVGGFEEWPLYEDWALFARAQKAGVRVKRVPGAVYVAHRRAQSRNLPSRRERVAAFELIRRAIYPELDG